MTQDRSPRLNSQISEEAAEWFVEFRAGNLDATARRAFDAWVRSSPEHLRAYLEIAAIWNESSSLDAERELGVGALLARAHSDENVVPLLERSTVPSAPQERATPIRRRAIAAVAAFVAFATVALIWIQAERAPTYATAVGEQRSIRLADGSTIELNSRSRVRVSFSEGERLVELLDGQALFNVAKNPVRPFVVRSGNTRVRAVGTQFDVYKKQGGTVVTVVEGEVAVVTEVAMPGSGTSALPDSPAPASADVPLAGRQQQTSQGPEGPAPILLSAGDQLTLEPRAVPRPARVNVASATAWTQRQLVLESAPLAEVAEEFNRYSTRRLIVEDSAENPLRLSGVFVTDPDFLIRYLKARPEITVRETQTEIRIVRHD